MTKTTATTVRCGDVLTIHDRPFIIMDFTPLHAGARRLKFVTGELLTIHPTTRLTALRAWAAPRSSPRWPSAAHPSSHWPLR